MRLGAIDIGTNSIHMIVAEVRPDFSFEVIDREKDMVRLGAGGLDGRALTDGALAAARNTLSKFAKLARSHQVDEIIASATSAVREAENGGDFLADTHRELGIRTRVISGTEEARLIHLAAAYGVNVGASRAVVIDIGGGSVEITYGTASNMELACSFKLGVIRMTERFGGSDPLAKRDERRMVKHVARQIAEHIAQILHRGFDQVIGTSGTILGLGALALSDGRPRGADALRNRRVPSKQIHRLRKQLLELDLDRRLRLPGLDPRRADLIVAGAIVLDTILDRLGTEEIVLCDFALREGLVLDYINRNRNVIAKVDRYPDERRRSVMSLAERCSSAAEHSRQVARLALALFDQTRSLHGLTDRERAWLEYAALLHDIGMHISYTRHHKHSCYLIENGDLRGFEPDEIAVMALVARYHRGTTPKRSHKEFEALRPRLRRTVKVLAAMVRLAEGLDRSHVQVIGPLNLASDKTGFTLRFQATGDAELELWAAQRQLAPLEEALGVAIRVELTERHDAEQPDDPAYVPGQAVPRRRHRRVGQNDAARPRRQVAQRRGPPRVHH